MATKVELPEPTTTVKIDPNELDVVGNNKFTCKECQASFTRKDSLKRHTVIHKNPDKFQCSQCSKAFTRCDALLRHEQMCHSVGERCICAICGSILSGKRNLNFHIARIHEGKKIQCSVCDQTFQNNWNLQRHIQRTHIGTQQECEYCKKIFSNLKDHLTICSKANPSRVANFSCDVCSKKFLQKKYLKEHIKYLHEDHKYTCVHCGCIYSHRKSRNAHEKKCSSRF